MNDFIPANQTTQLSKTQGHSESTLAGPERAAALLLSLGLDHGGKIWEQLDEMEIKEVSAAMVKLGYVDPAELELVLTEFVETLSVNGALTGSIENTERLLAKYLPSEQVTAVMAEIRGPAGRTMWEKLSNVQENVLASYLKNEYPQTIAVVLSQIGPDHAARVLSILPEELALEVIDRMLRIDLVQRDVLEKVEQTLRTEFMSNLTDSNKRDSHEIMADIFNSFDRQTEARFMSALDEDNRESAERIKALMFTFEDLMKLDASGCQALLQNVEKDQLTIALKGASEEIKEFFFSNMSGRAAKLLQDDMDALGPVRLSEVDVAQSVLVVAAKDLAAKGEIILASGGDEELVY